MRTRPYVGYKKDGSWEVFRASAGPTEELYGSLYNGVLGPFQTLRAANFYVKCGRGNPHTVTVSACERIAKDEYDKAQRAARIHCDSCQALMINGVFCHETGCPNTKKRWVDGEWVKVYECLDCGSEVLDGETCCQDE